MTKRQWAFPLDGVAADSEVEVYNHLSALPADPADALAVRVRVPNMTSFSGLPAVLRVEGM